MRIITENVNQFHVCDVLTVLHGWNLSPNGLDGTVQLVTHMLGEGRQSHVENGRIAGFYFNVVQMAHACRPHLEKLFPDLAKLKIDAKKSFGEDFRNNIKFKEWIAEIEKKFGKTVTVKPLDQYIAEGVAIARFIESATSLKSILDVAILLTGIGLSAYAIYDLDHGNKINKLFSFWGTSQNSPGSEKNNSKEIEFIPMFGRR